MQLNKTIYIKGKNLKFQELDTMHLSMVCPRMGGSGNRKGNLTFSGFEMSISPPLGLIVSKIPTPDLALSTFNEMICTYRKFNAALLQRVIVLLGKWSPPSWCIFPSEEGIF